MDNRLGSIEFPSDTMFGICIVSIESPRVSPERVAIRDGLSNILEHLYEDIGRSGRLTKLQGQSSKVGEYAKPLLYNRRTDVIGRLMTEVAVIAIIASHLDLREKIVKDRLEVSPLAEEDRFCIQMQRTLQRKQTIKLFFERSGLSSKKIQDGFRFIFGRSFANFLKDMS